MGQSRQNTALIAGVTGAIGSAVARELAQHEDWSVYGLSRRAPASAIAGVRYLSCDLTCESQTEQLVRSLKQSNGAPTHIFYCGRATHTEQTLENVEGNLELLCCLVDAVEEQTPGLQHIHLVQGGKYYGVHIGPFVTPARETDSRAPIENFNYAQQDFLEQRSTTADWTWTASRPNTLLHYSPNNARNLVSSLGAYAAICRELGAALDFPGPPEAYDSLTQATSLDLLARAIHWMATEPACANQGFNVTNTDVFRWNRLWPEIASAFDMPVGTVRPLKLSTVLSRREPLWNDICRKFDLNPLSLQKVANWGFVDATLERYWDEILCHNRVRAAGFSDWDNSEQAFFRQLKRYREAKILPP